MKLFVSRCVVLFSTLLLSVGIARAELSVSTIYSDHMVLQQGVPNTIWGWADPDTQVTVRFGDELHLRTKANPSGQWQVSLPAMEASNDPQPISISAGEDRIEIQDVLVGEVWFCSGQSNMQWRVSNCDRFNEFKADAKRPTIRMFTVHQSSMDEPAGDVSGQWQVCTPDSVGSFSGAAYHMGRTLSDHLNVPIGLVNSSWGGSSAEAWISPEPLSSVEPGRRIQAQMREIKRERDLDPEQFTATGIDEGAWLEGDVPGTSKAFGIPDSVDGIFYVRIPVEIPGRWAGRPLTLSLAMVDDDDITYFNGTEVGRTNGWQQPRVYDVPGELVRPGSALIAVRVTDGSGPGGIHGDADALYIAPADSPEDRLSLVGPARMIVAAEVSNLPAQHMPSHLYNGMLHPLRNYSFAGAAWYQGENNAIGEGRADEYDLLLPILIEDWRRTLDDPDLPFLIVQLPNWAHTGSSWNYPRLREAQRRTHEAVPHTGLIITTDIGDPADIHPRNKHDVGDRLGRWALCEVYGVPGIIQSGPIPGDITWEKDGIRIEFDTFGSPLAIRGSSTPGSGQVTGFEIPGPGGAFIPAKASITSDYEVTVSIPGTAPSPMLVRYAWAPDPTESDLVNAEGLPASPFELGRDAVSR